MSRFAVNKAVDPDLSEAPARGFRRPGTSRRILGIAILAVVVVAVVAVIADAAVGMRTERSFSLALRSSPRVTYDPEVTLSGFPFTTHARTGSFGGAVITARGVPVPCAPAPTCHAELGATLGALQVPDGFHIGPRDVVHTSSVSAYTRLDSVDLGRFLHIVDLTVNTPAPEGRAGAGGPGDGLLRRSTGVLLSGTVPLPPVDTASRFPPSASEYPGPTAKVSVSVDLSVVDGRLHLAATGFYPGPERHYATEVPADLRDYVLHQFTATLPALPLPWGIAPTGAHSEGSDVLLVGASGPSDLMPAQF